MSLMLKNKRITRLSSLTVVAVILSIFFTPFSVSQNPDKETSGTPAGWSDEINLSNSSSTFDQESETAYNGDILHAIWVHNSVDVYHKKSVDGGRSWTQSMNIYHSNLFCSYPDIDVSESYVHAVVADNEGWNGIYYRNSTDNGDTWHNIRRISADGVDAGDPSIFVNNSNVHVIWHDKRDGSNGEIYYRRSLNGGITFDNGQGVDADRRITFSPAAISGVNMAGDGSNISVVWADERNGNFDIYWMISKDNGYTWQDGLGNIGQDRQLTSDSSGSGAVALDVDDSIIHIVWRDESWPGPVYKIYYRNSTDNGATWNPIQLLSGPNTASFAPNVKAHGNNIWVMWNDNRDGAHEIFYKNSTDGGISWGVDTRLTENDGQNSYAPKMTLNDTQINVIWEDERDGNMEIYYKRYPDFPDTSPPSHSNETPIPDSYKDAPGTNVSIHVTDPSGVNESTIQLYVNGSLVSHTLTPITDGYNVSYESLGFEPGVVTCRIVAEDNCGNLLDYTWNFTVLALYGIQLHEGWNLISVPFAQVNTSIKEVLKDIDGKWDLIEYYDATSGEWKSYATFWPESLNEFQEINNTMAIWINITEPNVNLTSRGIISTYTEIPLKAGWNFVGYPTQTTETVGNALWGTGADRVEVFDASDPYRLKEVTSTYIMKPGEGYWVHVVADSVWAVNW